MTGLTYLLAAAGLPFVPVGRSLSEQAAHAAIDGLWIEWQTSAIGSTWEAA